jgi:hypothetical protein
VNASAIVDKIELKRINDTDKSDPVATS